jgi:NDP-sugar pyrophosphorylase family protein
MVLAAGLGLRMRPLTLLRAKPVLPVMNRPLLHWTLERLARHGVTDVIVNLHHLPETVTTAVGDGSAFGLRVRYSFEETILGRGGGPRLVRDFFGSESFLLVNGDVVFDFHLTRLVRLHLASKARATLALLPNPDTRIYGPVVTGPRGWIRSVAGRPRKARGTVSLFTGVQVLDPALLDRLPEGGSDILDLYGPLVMEDAESLLGVLMKGAWYDFGAPSLYRKAQLEMLKGRKKPRLVHSTARVGEKARVLRSVVGARARIGAGAIVERSVLWEDAVVEAGARVRDSIVTSGAVVGPDEKATSVMVFPPDRLPRSQARKKGHDAWVKMS